MSPRLEIDLDGGPAAVADVIAVMHAAFAEFALRGTPSGAMTETHESLLAEIATGTRLGVARLDGRAVASVKHHRTPAGALYFGRLGVVPDARGVGVAAELVGALRAHAHAEGLRGLTCLVRAEESRNIALYQRLGMEVTGRGDRVSRTGAVIGVVEMADAEPAQG